DAVASRAGVSKGGLLYNFPTKAKLMQGLVENYLNAFEKALEERTAEAGDGSALAAYIRLSADDCEKPKPSATWIFSAIAEDPEFLTPINAFKRQLFERLKGETDDLGSLLVCFLAIEGLRSMNLFDSDVLSEDERKLLVASLLRIAG
ncbi:MAG: TetR family transcriptional regulator, partial [Mesorhizobium sp.]